MIEHSLEDRVNADKSELTELASELREGKEVSADDYFCAFSYENPDILYTRLSPNVEYNFAEGKLYGAWGSHRAEAALNAGDVATLNEYSDQLFMEMGAKR